MGDFEKIAERGYIYQATDLEKIKSMLNGEKITFYLGIDPTADSLHIGHFFALTMVRRLQQLGHHAIILVGGATALIGDPTGKSDMRKMLTDEQVVHNKEEVKNLVKKFVKTDGDNPAIILDNHDWFKDESYIDFMRRIGVHFNVNKMLATQIYNKRLENGGLTFLELGYMLMQAYDFVYLNKKYGCTLEIGGSDQWANMVAGADLYRKLNFAEGVDKDPIEALTCPLLVKADGEKMGKTASGTLWISREKTTVYDFYQMFMNSYDEDVERLLAFFSDFDMDYIKKICKENIIEAKKIMAYEVTKLVHGKEEADKVQAASREVFANGGVSENMPTTRLNKSQFESGMLLIDLLFEAGLVASKSEARRLITQGGVSLNREKISDLTKVVNLSDFDNGSVILQKGKKTFMKVDII